jgi:chromosome segregation protein
MRLRQLELQGYKTFASRTQFAFDSGITAIVGPNGSGKSNIADAIRWVLGEQSYRSLRGKRTEDMIFSGSSQRARLGMASASLLLDNSEGWLPIEFSEVRITRRAYRSGENEYLVNGQRVRLRDIVELLAKSGLAQRTYTIVGQGLVDAVLSLRADDRRALFEEAAGISLYQDKRAEALSKLDETRANLLRVNDIINEIAPRLRRLERQAERAETHAMLAQQLEGLLRTWYGYQWRREQQNLVRARDALQRRADRLARRREEVEAFDERMAELRSQQNDLRIQLGNWHRESSNLHRQMEGVQRDLAVWQERSRLQARQVEDLQGEQAELRAQAQAARDRIALAEQEAQASAEALDDCRARAAEAQAELDAHEARREELTRLISATQARALDLAAQSADRSSRLTQINERRASLTQELAEHRQVIDQQRAQTEELRAQARARADEQARLQAEADELGQEVARLDARLAETQTRQNDLRAGLADARQTVDRLQSRLDLLTRLREEGEGLHSGARAVLRAAGRPLKGVQGTVAQLVRVPQEYEAALEVALGGHLQDLVVDHWASAQAAIAHLREQKQGRATFLPLDTVRPQSRLEAPSDPGVVGVGAELVQADPRLAPVVEMLLGRTLVVDDLPAARRCFDRLRGGFQIVTLAGEVLRSSGSVTGGEGRGPAPGQTLAREREWRELPFQVDEAQSRAAVLDRDLHDAYEQERQLRDSRKALTARQEETARAATQAHDQSRALAREAEQGEQQIAWRQRQIQQIDDQAKKLDGQESGLRAELQRLTEGKKETQAQAASLQAQLEELQGESLYQRLAQVRTEAAVAEGAWKHRRTALDQLRQGLDQLQGQVQAKGERIAALEKERASLLKQIEEQESKQAVVHGWLAALNGRIEPAEAEIARLDEEREKLEREEVTLRAQLREAESGHSQASLTTSRQEDRLERLRRQITDDFGLIEVEPTEGVAEQPPLPMGEMVSKLPAVENLPEGLEEEIHEIKAQLRRMGLVNPGAPEEYAEALDRYTFLSSQAADLEEAARGLREVIAELDEVMRQAFQETFRQVAERFKENFDRLFDGGAARLILTDPDDVTLTGIEIVARPPGKRQQSLALLSGGERSLTAVALIFALLQVRPPPFCILDEVDAMLDEANVGRFRRLLLQMSEQTQFIVITHNRGTIQAADTIYGVSMGEDSVSQVISLRLEGDRIATQDGADVEILKD